MKVVEIAEGIFIVEEFLSSDECDAYISESENRGYRDAKINTRLGSEDSKNVRNNQRIIFSDRVLAEFLYERLLPFLPKEINWWSPSGLNEYFRFYRYGIDQYFKWHVDGSHRTDVFEHSKLTLLIYLNDSYVGGETEFEGFKVKPKKGSALIFPHKLRHQGCSIVSGIKYALRTDVMYAKP